MLYVALYYLAGAVCMLSAALEAAEWMTSHDQLGSPLFKFVAAYTWAVWFWPLYLWDIARYARR